MSLETDVQQLVDQTKQLDATIKVELVDVNSDVEDLRSRVTDLEIQVGIPTGGNTIPGGGAGGTNEPDTGVGNDVIVVDPDGDKISVWDDEQNAWIDIPFSEIAPPVEIDIDGIIDQANTAISAETTNRVNEAIAAIESTVINDIQTQVDGLASTQSTIGTAVGDNTAAIVAEQTARADGDSALASQISTLVADVDSNHQAFVDFQTLVAADPDIATAEVLAALQAQIDDNKAAITNETSVRAAADSSTASQIDTLTASVGAAQSAVVSEQTARADADNAIVLVQNSLAARMDSADAAISNLETVTSGIDGTIASTVSTLQTTVDGMTTTVSDTASSVNGIEGKRALKINSNGQVTGIELLGGGTTGSQIKFQTQNFILYDPSTGIQTFPFYVSGGKTYINDASIKNASIDRLMIQEEAVSIQKATERNDTIYGTGVNNWQTAATLTFTQPEAANVIFSVAMQQGYSSGERATGFRVVIDGSIAFVRAMGAINDTPALTGMKSLGSGSHTIRIDWYGADSTVGLQNRTIVANVEMR